MSAVRHDWNLTEEQAVELQRELASQVRITPLEKPIRLIAGCDIAYSTTSNALYAAVVLVRISDGVPIESVVVRDEVKFPYVPGLLSFREVRPLIKSLDSLHGRPDGVMLDGQGIAHPRRFGLACHLGLWLDIPTIGCAKTWLIGDYEEPGMEAGETSPLITAGETVGAIMRSATGIRPVFVSPGHRIDVAGSIEIVRSVLSGYRQPIPTRLAHIAANEARSVEEKRSTDLDE